MGMPYIAGEQDCAHLVSLVNREVFNREVPIPSERETNIFKQTVQINDQLDGLFERVEDHEAIEGDVVLMICRGRLSHTGVLVKINGGRYVLHNVKPHGVLLQRLSDVERIGLKFEGIYRFKGELSRNNK